MDVTWQPQWQAQWGGLEAGMYAPSQPATGVVTADMTQAHALQKSATKVEIHVACKYALFPHSPTASSFLLSFLLCLWRRLISSTFAPLSGVQRPGELGHLL
jgi:hypothetical protein